MFKTIRVASAPSARLVVGVFDDLRLPRGLDVSAPVRKALAAAAGTPGFGGATGQVTVAGDHALLVGLGKKSDLTAETLRTVGAKLARSLVRMKIAAVSLDVHRGLPKSVGDAQAIGRCLGEGITVANWRVDAFDGTATQRSKPLSGLRVDSSDRDVKKGLRVGLDVAECVNEARRLGATPPNICNPPWIASEARKLARKYGLTCRVISYAQAQQLGMGGLVNVGRGSKAKPCLITLEYTPKGRAKNRKTVCLVGKTITYDTGGYSLKIQGSMRGMKADKNGGMAVIGAMCAIARRKPKSRVIGLLPAAENMVSDDAYRPDDIITMYNGATVEVTNTDAEGRLVLADALAYACKKYKPDAILDTATLTGGVVVALGSWSSGVWCNDDDLLKRVEKAADATGEKVWRLPLWTEHRDFMRAKHADLWNSGPKRDGHPIQGAAFLSFFVDEATPWAHIDIAGVSVVDGDTSMHVAGPTGYGVRLLTEVVEQM